LFTIAVVVVGEPATVSGCDRDIGVPVVLGHAEIRDLLAESVGFTKGLVAGKAWLAGGRVGTDPGKKGILMMRVRGVLCSVPLRLLLLLLLLLLVGGWATSVVGTLISRILGFGLLSITIGIVVTVDVGESLIGSVGLVLL